MTEGANLSNDPNFAPGQDLDAVQAIVLAAAINGNTQIRGKLPKHVSAFEEPYRTVAAKVTNAILAGQFVDKNTIGLLLEGCHLSRCTVTGVVEPLTVKQVVNLIFSGDVQPGQAEGYLGVLQAHQHAKQKVELKEVAVDLAKSYGDQPEMLLAGVEKLVAEARKGGFAGGEECQSELFELIPFMKDLAEQQTGTEFLGLDSGFPHVNNLCNGLYTGLGIIAAPPGAGKTTLMWQMACQVAEINTIPVIFVSLEQSKGELRAKALARLSKLQYRHILRGRLHSDDPHDLQKLLDAAKKYALIAQNLTIIEGDDTTTIDKIQEVAAAKMAKGGASRCLVVLDYLQVLPVRQQDGFRASNTKDRVDLHVSALRRLARKLNSPVLAISSENRAGYGQKKLDVFKESGGIEYSADIAMVLTRDKKNAPGADSDYRPMDLNIVKNRNGECGVVKFKFYPKCAQFIETGKEALVDEGDE